MAETTHRAAFAQLPEHFAPMPAVMRTLARFDRTKIEGFITVAIGLLDVIDGDSDVELNGDELDANHAEDDHLGDTSQSQGLSSLPRHECEDAEEDDPAEEDDHSGDPLDEGEGTLGVDV